VTAPNIADLIEELTFLRAGKPFHTHRWLNAQGVEQTKRCSSPYCSTLGEPREEEISRA
jgi:hypothetical protein